MKIKSILFAIATHLIFGAFSVFIVDQFQGKTVDLEQLQTIEKQKTKLVKAIKASEDTIIQTKNKLDFVLHKVDSLEAVVVRIRKQSAQQELQVDSLIADDSSRAVEQYRIALMNLGVVPDMSERLSFKEIGHGAKFMFQFQGLALQVNVADQTNIDLQEALVLQEMIEDEQDIIIRTKDELLMWSSEEVQLYKTAYEQSTRFMANRLIVYLGFGGSYTADQVIRPSIQLGLGVRIWGND